MVRVTLSFPDEIVAFARVEAAKAGTSVSRWIADQVSRWWEADQASDPPRRKPKAKTTVAKP